MDARWYQIAFLSSFLLIGALARDFALTVTQVLSALLGGVLTQALWLRRLGLPHQGHSPYLSAVITALGLSVLVRADNAWVHPLLCAVAVSSKFIVRAGQGAQRSHVFNPANLGAFLAWAVLPGAWLSPGQWGSDSLLALWFIVLGGWVTGCVGRTDISLSFLLAWASLLAARLWVLGTEPVLAWHIWLHQFATGSTLLYAFFMISDPMTTPQRRAPRIAWAIGVASAAFVWQFVLYRPHGLVVVLVGACLAVPLVNRRWPGRRVAWAVVDLSGKADTRVCQTG